jgi:hypothetical protein
MEAAPKPLRTAASALVMVGVEKKGEEVKGCQEPQEKI